MNTKKISITTWVMRVILVLAAFSSLVPIYFAAVTSFKTMNEFYKDVWAMPETLIWQNYVDAFSTGRIGDYFLNSVIITIATIVGIQVCAILCAYALARLKVPHTEIIVVVLLAFQILPTEAKVIPLYIIMSKIGIMSVPYLAQIIAYIGWSLAGTTVIMKNFFQSVPNELLESARMDGSSEMNTMLKIVLPLMKSSLMTCVVLNFTFAWGELMWAQIATLMTDTGIPLTVGLLNFQGEFGTQWPLLSAAMIMILIPLFVFFAFAQRYFVIGITSGSVKG